MRRTLPQQIQANKRASVFYAFLIVLLLAALGGAIAGTYAPDHWWLGAAGAAGLGGIVALIATMAGPGIVLSIAGAREASPTEDRVLDNVAEEMAIAGGVPKPRVMIVDDSAPNAFATGKDPKSGVVVFSTGLIEKLDRDELQGVMAHEIAHIRNYDIRFMTTIALVAGLIPMLADFFLRMMWYGGGRSRRSNSNDNSAAIFMVIGLVLAILAPLFAKLLELAVSRKREFLADATAAEMTRYPEGLARALQKIAGDPEPLEVANRATQHMYIVNPLRGRNLTSLFSTHPPTEDRVRALLGLMGSYRRTPLPPGDFSDMPEPVDPRSDRCGLG